MKALRDFKMVSGQALIILSIWSIMLFESLAGCATAKTAEATEQTTGRYLLEIDRSNDQSSDRGQILLSIVFIIPHSVHRSLEWLFLSFTLVVF